MDDNSTNNAHYRQLAEKLLKGTITPEEEALFEKWYAGFNDEEIELKKSRYESSESLKAGIYQAILRKIRPRKIKNNLHWRIASAAALIVCISLATYFYLSDSPTESIAKHHSNSKAVMPGGNSATLMMEDGQEIDLDELADGHQIEVGNSLLQKNKDGELMITMLPPATGTQISHVSFNTISTPKGGNYKVILADGTNVWLNSSSVLKFPTVFINNERKVELAGEGYFDVKEDRNKPFIVHAKGQEVRVLGTEFNVSAYADEENIKTTLMEGSVSVLYNKQLKTIRPGEQSIVDKNGLMKISSVDVAFAKAWKEGYFAFDKLSVEEAMNQISRWYDVQIVFEGKVPNKELTGQISKKVNLSTIVEIMEFNGMDLEFKNNRLIVKE